MPEKSTKWMLFIIFLLKALELTFESLRIALMAHGYKLSSSSISIVDVLLSLVALNFLIKYMSNWRAYAAYALGYGVGNYIGLTLFEILCGK